MATQQETNTGINPSNNPTQENFPGVQAAIIKKMLAASDEMNVEKSLEFCTDDVLYKFGNLPMVYGKQGIREASAGFLQNFKSLKHDIKNIWEIGETVVVAMEVNYIRYDNKTFALPCCNIFQMNGEKVREMQIYMDISPVFT
jgi:ketosteroid isomerase-like protein